MASRNDIRRLRLVAEPQRHEQQPEGEQQRPVSDGARLWRERMRQRNRRGESTWPPPETPPFAA